jgi:hypothetical protein
VGQQPKIKIDAQGLLEDLSNRAIYYGAITQPEDRAVTGARRAKLINLSRIEAKPSYQFLLYLLDREAGGKCSEADTNKIIDLIANYFVRRNLTGAPATNRLDAIFIDLIARCEQSLTQASPTFTYDFVREALVSGKRNDAPASDEAMRAALNDHIYGENPVMARYLLCHFVETRATQEKQIDLWRRDDKNRLVWTIEHVLPQGTPLRAGWVDMLASGDADAAFVIQDEHVQLLGNLTLTAYNSTLSNAVFPSKQERTTITVAGEQASIGYKNGMVLNTLEYALDGKTMSLDSTHVWNERHILARREVMTTAIMNAYQL